jgi:hypothetical protein
LDLLFTLSFGIEYLSADRHLGIGEARYYVPCKLRLFVYDLYVNDQAVLYCNRPVGAEKSLESLGTKAGAFASRSRKERKIKKSPNGDFFFF